jgi:hypothetical protein
MLGIMKLMRVSSGASKFGLNYSILGPSIIAAERLGTSSMSASTYRSTRLPQGFLGTFENVVEWVRKIDGMLVSQLGDCVCEQEIQRRRRRNVLGQVLKSWWSWERCTELETPKSKSVGDGSAEVLSIEACRINPSDAAI